jgi:pimeloyl-ACP methyl ester carboxylesterase
VGTVDVARDLEVLRRALGDDRLTFLGISYGTLLGATYADLHPERIRAMALDGAIDPALDTATLSGDQAVAMEAQLNGFFTACASGRCAWRPAGPPAEGFAALADRLRNQPLVASDGTDVGVAELYGAVLSRMYAPTRWPSLATALAALERGDADPVLALDRDYFGLRPDATINADASNAINCLDHPVARDPRRQSALAAAAAQRAPVFGPYLSWGGATCAAWGARPTRVPHPVSAVGSPPIVVVGTTHDPATPYAWARSLGAQLANGVLLTRDGTGHVGVLGSGCVRTLVSGYLLTGTPPAPGTVCR